MKKEEGYDPKACYGSIPNILKPFLGMKKGSDISFGVDLGYFFYLHDRHYRNERKVRQTRLVCDNLLSKRTLNKFKSNRKYLLGLYIASAFWIALRPFGYFTWVK